MTGLNSAFPCLGIGTKTCCALACACRTAPQRIEPQRAPQRAPTLAQREVPARETRVESAPSSLEMAFVGDVIFGRYRASQFAAICQADCGSLFSSVASLLASDLTVANLETPIVPSLPLEPPINTRTVFGATNAHVALLRAAGFHALNVANNHWFDQRFEGVTQTPSTLRAHDIVPLGEAVRARPWVRAVTIERRSMRVAFIAFASVLNKPLVAGRPMVPFVEIDDIARRVSPVVREAAHTHDVVVVSAHWGEEYVDHPSSAQESAARALVDAGATLFIGHHPHVLQRIERRGRSVIAYSLGNFLFDNPELAQRETGVLRVRARRGCVASATFHPVLIEARPMFHPVAARAATARTINARLGALSSGALREEGDALVLDRSPCDSQ